MPFIKKNDANKAPPPSATQKIFVGRVNELLFFREQLLKPADPAYNIISIYGDGGVGKSTLLQRVLDELHMLPYSDYCLAALVDERQATPASMMERFAEQLHMAEFKKALQRYRDALHRQQSEEETMQDAVLQHAPDFAGAAVEGVPFVGPLLREGIKLTASRVLHEQRAAQARYMSQQLEDPLGDLTRTFLTDLNRLAESEVTLDATWSKRKRRILLFFDTFEQLASEAAPWLLDYLLPADISSNVVLVVAGRIPLDRAQPTDPKRWMPYHDNNIIHYISLNSFTEDETRAYLAQRGITEPAQVETIWRLSRGLPLYLSLLTFNPQRFIDPTTDVVANFLRWIPEQEAVKRRLVLDAALFTRPFNQDDLAAFSYIAESERAALYRWLIVQPFVQPRQDGRYSYHELAEDLFSRHLYQNSPGSCYATRRSLAHYYQEMQLTIQTHGGPDVYYTTEWLVVTLALAQQLLLVPDLNNHAAAVAHILNVYHTTKQDEEISRILHALTQEQQYNHASSDAREWATLLLAYVEAEPLSLDLLAAGHVLLQKIASVPQFPGRALARVHHNCGVVYRNINSYQSAVEEFTAAIQSDPHYASAYGNRGITYRAIKRYDEALNDFNAALALNSNMDWVYAGRGEVYRHQQQYQQALNDFDQALALDPDYSAAYAGRGRVYRLIRQYERSIDDFDRALSLDQQLDWAYVQRAETYRALHEYERAIEDYDHAVDLNESYFWAYGSRGFVYFSLGQYDKALDDYNRALEVNPSYIWAYAERGRVYRHQHRYKEAIADFTRAIALEPQDAWAYSHRGLAYVSLHEYQLAVADFDMAIALQPNYGRTYGRRASAYLGLHNLEQAGRDYARSCELSPTDSRACWMSEWVQMCLLRPDLERATRLEQLAERDSRSPFLIVARAVALWLRGHSAQARALLADARLQTSTIWDVPFWQGLISCACGDATGIEAIEQALQMDMFPILLRPLRLLETEQAALYQQHLAPLQARYIP